MEPIGGMTYPPPGAGYPAPPMTPGWMIPAPPPPRPRGTPNRSLFVAGAVGHFVAAGMAIPFAVFSLTVGFSPFFGFFSLTSFVSAAMMAAGLAIQFVGFYGLWRNYGTRLGLAALVYGLAATIFFLTAAALPAIARDPILFYSTTGSFIAFGVMFVLDGCSFVLARHFMNPEASIAAGALFIIAGSFIGSILFAPVGGILAVPALIVGGIVLVHAQIPVPYPQQTTYGPVEPRPPIPPPP